MIVCFDIGGSAIKTASATSPGDLTMLGRRPTPLDDLDAFVATLAGAIAEADVSADAPVAISITGVVDPDTRIIKCANIPAIDGLKLADLLAESLARPVEIANDADCFALAEAGMGAGRGHRIVFGAILGTGVGGGLVIDGRLVTGAGGYAGEWGHGPVAATRAGHPPADIPRLPCGCGLAGCVDTVGGARGMERLHKHLHGIDLASREIVAAWDAGDPAAARTVEVQVDLLAGPLALVANIVGANIIPVGGGLANATRFVAALDEAVRARILRRANVPLVVPGACRTEPGLVGAALLGFSGAAA